MKVAHTPSNGARMSEDETSNSITLRLKVWRLLMPLPMGRRLLPWIVEYTVYCVAVALIVDQYQVEAQHWGAETAALNGVVLGVLFVFRNNAAYERWWEGRKLWGQLVNDSRNICIKTRAFVQTTEPEYAEFGRLIYTFADALRMHLRDRVTLQELNGYENSMERPAHVPLYLSELIQQRVGEWQRDKKIDGYQMLSLDAHTRGMMDICGACERIKNTPIPLSYRAILRHGIGLYLISTPWVIVQELEFWCIPVMVAFCYFILGVELIAEEIEDPFGEGPDDLDLARYSQTIRKSVQQSLGSD